jgi:hypothetical protein
LPLWILSALFYQLLPLAVTSLCVSLGVCIAASAQADLPKRKLRPWSRPLVALLFFLQPIVRGWARYQGRLLLRPAPLAAQQTLDSVALRESGQPLRVIEYWSAKPFERVALVADISRRLDQQGWPNKSDAGWCDYDVEVYGSRWSNLELTTVAEDMGLGKHLLRCRLLPRWSFAAKVLFGLLAGLEVLVLGFAVASLPWLWLLPLLLPAFAWALHREQRTLQSTTAVLLDELAQEWDLTKTPPDSGSPCIQNASAHNSADEGHTSCSVPQRSLAPGGASGVDAGTAGGERRAVLAEQRGPRIYPGQDRSE